FGARRGAPGGPADPASWFDVSPCRSEQSVRLGGDPSALVTLGNHQPADEEQREREAARGSDTGVRPFEAVRGGDDDLLLDGLCRRDRAAAEVRSVVLIDGRGRDGDPTRGGERRVDRVR